MYCKNCGNSIKGDDKFCLSCGTNFEAEKPSEKAGETVGETVSQDFPTQGQNSQNPDNPNQSQYSPFNQEERARLQLNKAFWNGIFAIAFSVWALIVVFADLFSEGSIWPIVFIISAFVCSFPAILQAFRGRKNEDRTRFLAALIMGIISTVISIVALVYWLAT